MSSLVCSTLLMSIALLAFTRSAHIRFKSLECRTVDPTFCNVQRCTMKPIGRNVKEASVVIKLLKVPVTNVTVRGGIRRRGSSAPLFKFHVDACRFLQADNRNPVAHAFYKFLRFEINSNMNHSCPYDHDLIVDHMRVDETFNMPLPIGMGDFEIQSFWHAYNVLRATVAVVLEIS